jgi:DNA-directed RNA polymerase specialized sigma24 family protein
MAPTLDSYYHRRGHGMTTDPGQLMKSLPDSEVDRVIRGVIRRVLPLHAQDHEDVRGDALLLLVRKVHQLESTPSAAPIADWPAYVATLAHHACYAYLRRRRPQWMRLRNQVRYVVGHDADISLEQEADRLFCAVRASWTDGGALDLSALPLRDLAKVIVARAGGRLALDELVAAVADVRGVRDADTPVSSRGDMEAVADPCAPASVMLDTARYLQSVWREVQQLPLRQRWALRLNLRNTSGQGLLSLLPLTGTASMRQIADVLELPAHEFARLWKDLPMDDRSIAARLGLTRQQVINLRKSARERLSRRLGRSSERADGNTASRSAFFILRHHRSVHRSP